MSAITEDESFPIITVAASGIENLSPLIPLLGTGHCERLVTSALRSGLLYAAATPMSIFGSLGIAKAGFIVLWTSIDTRLFHGPTLIHNAGFLPSSVGTLLGHVDDNNRHIYIAEDKIRRILSKKRVRAVKINLFSRDLVLWNLRLILATFFLSILGLIPYIFPIARYLPDQPFQATWLFPVLRIAGCDIVAVAIQFTFQIRILEETYYRIRFMAADSYLKDHGKSLPDYWDPNERSKDILFRLKLELKAAQKGQSIDPNTTERLTENLGKISSFRFPDFMEENPPKPTSPQSSHSHSLDSAEAAMPQSTIHQHLSCLDSFQVPEAYFTALATAVTQALLLFGLIVTIVGYIGCFSIVQAGPRNDWKGTLFWLGLETLLAVVRTAVWAKNPAWDDAKSPIALEKLVVEHSTNTPLSTAKSSRLPTDVEPTAPAETPQQRSRYGLGWMLDAVTADDMHALIVGVDDFGAPGLEDLMGCVHDAKLVAEYLEDTLLVPRKQIVKLYNKDATKERIIEELKALAEKATIMDDAPIVIYFATHSLVSSRDKRTYLVPHQDWESPSTHTSSAPSRLYVNEELGLEFEEDSLSYDTVVDLLGRVSQAKTDNITLILDTCHAGAMGRNEKFAPAGESSALGEERMPEVLEGGQYDPRPYLPRGFFPISSKTNAEILVGHSSHVLIAGTGPGQLAYEDKAQGGVFTQALLDVLTSQNAFHKMTHKNLVKEINEKMPERDQAALCTSIYQNRLLFNGLLSRRIAEDGGMPVITVQYSDL